jgi:DNA-binding CsgD family transcriptional regulator
VLVRNRVLNLYRALWGGDTTGVATPRDPLVGRREELAFLRDRLAEARAGSGHVVLVCGQAGIGKTRLVEELTAAADGMQTGWGGALDDAGMPPLWPWIRAVRDLPAPRTAVASVVAGSALREYGSAEETVAATFAADTGVVDALGEQSRAGPGLLLVLDDMQWADGATLRLLERVASEARRLPMLVVGMHRDPAGGSLPGSIAHRAEVLSLRPLTQNEAAAVLSAAVEEADPAAVRRAAELSGGNPLYLATLTRVAAEQLRGRASWDDAVGEAPELRHLVAAAMRAAGPDAAHAVGALSVLGPEADMDLAARLLDAGSPGAVSELLLPAVPAGLVERLPSSATQVRFAHALVRSAVYASLPPQRRAALHGRAAELLEPLAIARDERAGAVAQHWERAGQPDRAVKWAVRAADAARAAGAHDEAVRYLEFALDTVDRGAGDDEIHVDRAELLLSLAREEYLAGRIGKSLDACVLAAGEGERTGRAEIVARSAIIVQGIGDPAVNLRLEDLCRRALLIMGDGAAPDLRARVEAQLACALIETGSFDGAAHWAQDALANAAASGDPDAELDAIRARANLESLPGFHAEMFELGGRAIELAGPAGRPIAELWGHVWRSDSAIHRGDITTAETEIGAMQALADRTGLPLVRWHVLRRRASVAALTGGFDTCRRLAAQAAEIAAEWEDQTVRGTAFGQSVCLALLRGDPADLAPGWTGYLDDPSKVPGSAQVVAHACLAAALLLAGRPDEARVLYQPLISTIAGMQRNLLNASLFNLAALAPGLNDAAGCRALREVVSAVFGRSPALGAGTVFYAGSVARMIGGLDIGCGEYAAAVPHFEEGLRVDSLLGARPYVAWGRMGLARALGALGDLPRAVELARAAATEARRLDMPGLLRAADTFLADAAAKARAEDPLTAREREVAELVAQALSNREVARTLVLSERTVESHVRSILAKTGLTSRTELTRWFLQQRPGPHGQLDDHHEHTPPPWPGVVRDLPGSARRRPRPIPGRCRGRRAGAARRSAPRMGAPAPGGPSPAIPASAGSG